MKTTKIFLILFLSASVTSVIGQTENQNERSIKEKGVYIPKQTQGATFGERKGWDGSIKGNKIQIIPSDGGIMVIFPNDLAFKIDDVKGSITETKVNTSAQNRVAGTPIRGIIVKGGKNPGGQMRDIDKKDVRFYELPAEWTDGSYLVQVSYEPETIETSASADATTASNARGKTKGKVVKAGGNFILEKQGTSYAVSSVSSMAGAGGGAAAASYAKTVQ